MSIDLSLERIREIYDLLPQYTRPTIHIAGTNGKGSVCALVYSVLRAGTPPLSVGRFNSPHMVSVYDSILIDDKPISQELFNSAKSNIQSVGTKYGIEVSGFELLTLIALVVFERAKVDFVVLEVGMGGRLDATNVIPDSSVVVSALTAVDLDHQAFLGNTISAITKEKASIVRQGKPFVLGPQKYAEVERICKEIVAEKGGELCIATRVAERSWNVASDGPRPSPFSMSSLDLRLPTPQSVSLNLPCFPDPLNTLFPLHGSHQLDNLAVAATIISLLISHPSCSSFDLTQRLHPVAISRGIANVTWPGRLSFHVLEKSKLLVLVDGAHNPASAESLSRYIHRLCRMVKTDAPTTIWISYILALSHSPPKTPLQTLSSMLPPAQVDDPNVEIKFRVAALRFTPPEGMPWVKSVSPVEIRDVVNTVDPDAKVWIPEEGGKLSPVAQALQWASKSEYEHQLVVIAGSLYLVADFYRMLYSKM
ncbi:Mur ligase [Marasmius fiardii PR-910]|nr:Mur ligase [Marasmius fiardii PR-910]